MTTIIQLNQEDLKIEIREALREILYEIDSKQSETKQPDRGGIELAEQVLGRSKSWIYKATMTNQIPFRRFNSTLVFNRVELEEWMTERTISANNSDNVMSERLAESAKKKLLKYKH
jgi:predicted DNA-binding transcriptional regulator AlpA